MTRLGNSVTVTKAARPLGIPANTQRNWRCDARIPPDGFHVDAEPRQLVLPPANPDHFKCYIEASFGALYLGSR